MIGLKLTSFRKESAKAAGMDSFVNLIPDAKKKSEINLVQVNDNYNNILSEALGTLRELSVNFTRENFEKAAENLYECQKLKSNKAEPYFYLAWLFLFVDEIELALKYMRVASAINPQFEGLEILKDKISEIQLLDSQLQKTALPVQSEIVNPVSKEQPSRLPIQKITSNLNTARIYSAYNSRGNF